MSEENLVTTFATVENGVIVIPKVYLPDGISLKVQLHLGKSLEIAFFRINLTMSVNSTQIVSIVHSTITVKRTMVMILCLLC